MNSHTLKSVLTTSNSAESRDDSGMELQQEPNPLLQGREVHRNPPRRAARLQGRDSKGTRHAAGFCFAPVHTPTHLYRIVQIDFSCKSPSVLRISIAPVHPRILIGDIFASLGLLKNFGELRRVLKRMLRTSYSRRTRTCCARLRSTTCLTQTYAPLSPSRRSQTSHRRR